MLAPNLFDEGLRDGVQHYHRRNLAQPSENTVGNSPIYGRVRAAYFRDTQGFGGISLQNVPFAGRKWGESGCAANTRVGVRVRQNERKTIPAVGIAASLPY
jgi:hypothetical protein